MLRTVGGSRPLTHLSVRARKAFAINQNPNVRQLSYHHQKGKKETQLVCMHVCVRVLVGSKNLTGQNKEEEK